MKTKRQVANQFIKKHFRALVPISIILVFLLFWTITQNVSVAAVAGVAIGYCSFLLYGLNAE